MPEAPFSGRNEFNGDVRDVYQAASIEVHNGPRVVGPREGPLVRPEWTGREPDVEKIADTLREGRPVAIVGDEGCGKTAVAAMVLDALRERFPDGQLYVDLEHEEASQALHSMLLRLGIDAAQIPPNLEGRASLLQSVTRDRRLLLVVDGVTRDREAAQFRPASKAAGYLVVSRNPMRDQDYVNHRLGPLSPQSAADHLRQACPNLDEAVVPRLVEEFGGHPADLRALAGLIRHRSLSDLFDVREALAGSSLFEGVYDGLTEAARWLYRLLASLPGTEFERALTGIFTGSRDWSLGGLPAPFEELLDAGLALEVRPGWYRVEHGIAGEAPARGEAVPIDLFSAAYDSLAWHARRAQLADIAVMGRDRLRYAPRLPIRVDPPAFGGSAEAMEWFRSLHTALQDSLRIAARHRWSDMTWALAEALWAYFANTAQDREAAACFRTALAVADGPVAVAHLSSMLGMCLIKTEAFAEAGTVLDRGLVVATEALSTVDDPADRLSCTYLVGTLAEVLGRLRRREGRFAEARELLSMSLANAEELGRPRAIGIRLRAIAELLHDEGAFAEAERTWRLAIDSAKEAGDERNMAGAALDLAMLRFASHERGALAEVDAAVAQVTRAGLWQLAAETHERIAWALAERGAPRFNVGIGEVEPERPHEERLRRALELYEAHGALLDAERVRRTLDLNGAVGR
ncbi:AAA family ATPase [Glycomyces sp. NPDC021274]|uniref:AAA family ATPase n=1 Tax=Glycomyces sp. NPDC021274 TaxID=3155120 RepID=UPI0033C8CF29